MKYRVEVVRLVLFSAEPGHREFATLSAEDRRTCKPVSMLRCRIRRANQRV